MYNTNSKTHYSTKEAADALGYSYDYVSKLCRTGYLKAERSGNAWLIAIEDLEAFKRVHASNMEEYRLQAARRAKRGKAAPRFLAPVCRAAFAAVFAAVIFLGAGAAYGKADIAVPPHQSSQASMSASAYEAGRDVLLGTHTVFNELLLHTGEGILAVLNSIFGANVAYAPSDTHSSTTVSTVIESHPVQNYITNLVTNNPVSYVYSGSGVSIEYVQRAIDNVRRDLARQPRSSSAGGTDVSTASIEDLADVGAMTKSVGDLLYWNGSAWSNIATSSLGLGGGVTAVSAGGTGTSTAPAYGQLLMGDGAGGYALVATSSLGINAGAAAAGGASGQVQFNDAGSLNGNAQFTFDETTQRLVVSYASTTALSSAYASSTNFFAGTATLGNLSGILKATGGLVSVAAQGVDYESPLSFVYPIVRSVNSISLAFGTTTQNFWSAYNNFSSLFATNASSTNATTTSLGINSETFTDLTGTGLQNVGGALTINATGNWTGTFDGQEGTYYLDRTNHTGTQLASTISDFNEAAQDTIGGALVDSTRIDLVYDDALNTFTADIRNDTIANSQLQFNTGQHLTTTSNVIFTSASTTLLANIGTAYFGSTATTTISSDGSVVLPSGATLTIGTLTGLLKATSGVVSSATAGTDYIAGGAGAATTTVSCTGTASCSGFTVFGSSPITITGAGGGLSSYDAWTHPLTGWSATTSIMRMAGLYSTASSTIGDGTQAGGLIISGGATTTANAYFGAKLGIGVQAPSSLLSVNYGFGGTQPIDITQSGTSIFTIDNSGRPTFSPTSATAGGSLYTFGNATGQVFSGGIAMMLNPQTVDSSSFLFGALVNNSIKFLISGTGATAIGTSSPWGYLAVNPTALGSGVPEFVVGSSSATHLIVDGAGNVGIGTTSPVSQLAVQGSGTFSGSLVAQNLTLSNTLFLSGYGNGLLTNTGGTVGIATAGTDYLASYDAFTHPSAGQSATTSLMLFSGAASSTQLSATQAYFGGTATSTFTSAGFLGIASSSPWAQLSINPTSAIGTAPAFAIGSTSSTTFLVTNAGRVGIGTTSPGVYDLLVERNFAGNTTIAAYNNSGAGTALLELNSGINSVRITSLGTSAGSRNVFTSTRNMLVDSAGDLTLGTNSIDRVTIKTGTGLVGIGTTTPRAGQLSIASTTGSQLSLSDGSATAAPFNFRAINNNLYISTSSPTTFATTSSSIFSLNSATGSTTLLKLDVSGNATSSFGAGINLASGCFSINNVCVGSGSQTPWTSNINGGGFTLTNTSQIGVGTSTPWATLAVNPVAGAASNQFVVGSSTATAFVINNAGNVGIGTTSPYAKLSVEGPGVVNAVINTTTTGATNASTLVINRGDSANGFAGIAFSTAGVSNWTLNVPSATSDLRLFNHATAAELMRFTTGGNVGIGTTTPGVKLSVFGAGGTGGFSVAGTVAGLATANAFYVDNNSGDTRLISVGADTATKGSFSFVNSGLSATGFTTAMTISSTGNVGIATSSPIDLLSIYGGASAGAINLGVWDSLRNGISLNGNDASSATGYNILSGLGDPNLYLNRPSGSAIKFREANSSTDQLTLLTGGSATLPDGNFSACTGGACPTGTPAGNGNIIAETAIGVGTSTPWAGLSIVSGKAIVAAENTLATTTSMTVDWRNGNQQLVRLGTSGTTISFSGFIEGQKLVLTVCNPNATAGAISWGTQVLWSSGTAPTQTTTANKCDVWSFLATNATSTLKIFGAQSANF